MVYNNSQQYADFLQAKYDNRKWNEVKIMIFDAPQAMDLPYSQRLDILQQSNCLFILW
jgi:hypothetical protein